MDHWGGIEMFCVIFLGISQGLDRSQRHEIVMCVWGR